MAVGIQKPKKVPNGVQQIDLPSLILFAIVSPSEVKRQTMARNGVLFLAGASTAARRKIHCMGKRSRRASRGSTVSLLMVTLVALLSSCSRGQNEQAAVEALNQSLKREMIVLPLSLGRIGSACGDLPDLKRDTKDITAVPRFRAAQKAGLITIAQDGPGFWKVEGVDLKPAVLDHLKKVQHNQTNGCDSVLLSFAVATKSVVAISALHKITDEKAEAEFTWNWALTPAGTKLVNALSEQERRELDPRLEGERRGYQRDPTFTLANITKSSVPHPGKKTLKKSGDSWTIDE